MHTQLLLNVLKCRLQIRCLEHLLMQLVQALFVLHPLLAKFFTHQIRREWTSLHFFFHLLLVYLIQSLFQTLVLLTRAFPDGFLWKFALFLKFSVDFSIQFRLKFASLNQLVLGLVVQLLFKEFSPPLWHFFPNQLSIVEIFVFLLSFCWHLHWFLFNWLNLIGRTALWLRICRNLSELVVHKSWLYVLVRDVENFVLLVLASPWCLQVLSLLT